MTNDVRYLTCSTSFSALDLRWQRVEIDEKEFAQIVHLVRYFCGRLVVTMHSLISVKSKLVGPRLQFGGDAMLCSHPVNTLLDLPGVDVLGEGLQCQFHGLPVHTGRGVEMPGGATASRLAKRFCHSIRNVGRRFVHIGRRIHAYELEHIRAEHVAAHVLRIHAKSLSIAAALEDRANRLVTGVASCSNANTARRPDDLKLRLDVKRDFRRFTVRAVVNQGSHVEPGVNKKDIVA